MTDASGGPTAGESYRGLIDAQLAETRETKASLEQRGLAVITTSGALVTLLLGIVAIVKGPNGFVIPGFAALFLAIALLLFASAAIAGLIVNWPREYNEVKIDDLRNIVANPDYWDAPAAIGQRRSAEVLVDVAADARALNNDKGRWLIRAMTLEVVAVAVLGLAVVLLLAAGVRIGSPSPNPTLTGTLTLEDSKGWGSLQAGDPCMGQRGYEDIRAGTEVVVTNGLGKTLKQVGHLEPGQLSSQTECEFAFTIVGIPALEQYTFEVSDRGEFLYSADQLKAADWHVDIRLTE